MKIVKSHKTKTFMVLYIIDRDINMGRDQTFYTTFIVYQYYNLRDCILYNVVAL